jgi:hypothetical protein
VPAGVRRTPVDEVGGERFEILDDIAEGANDRPRRTPTPTPPLKGEGVRPSLWHDRRTISDFLLPLREKVARSAG